MVARRAIEERGGSPEADIAARRVLDAELRGQLRVAVRRRLA